MIFNDFSMHQRVFEVVLRGDTVALVRMNTLDEATWCPSVSVWLEFTRAEVSTD